MPICKKCSNHFPSLIKIDGKTHNVKSRSYCLNCSPFKNGKGYELRKEKPSMSRIGQPKMCPICNKMPKKYYKNTVCSSCRSKERRHRIKIKLKHMLGGKCVKCGFDDIRILHFHHKNPSEKLFTLSSSYASNNINLLTEEASKCELLCPNCHALEHLD